ncbi:MAG TPA: ATP-binding cassette domain-containing protein, partial [Pseudobdellovibrionaceae bacterium]|nr:ATP-binding cassette domain-containing protein [Pseudobdellovibrionaceae bacterium]
MKPSENKILLDVQNVKKYFPVHGGLFSQKTGEVKALNEVSFQVQKGETLGVVGESGCGKSTLGKTLLRLHAPDGGHVFFNQQDLFSLSAKELLPLRQKIQMIFQDP